MHKDKEKAAAYARGWRARNKEYLKQHKQNYHYEKNYGLKKSVVDEAKILQGSECLLCNKTEYLHLDHCHATGRVRGFICNYCNMCLGWVERIGITAISDYIKNADTGLTVTKNGWMKKTTLCISSLFAQDTKEENT